MSARRGVLVIALVVLSTAPARAQGLATVPADHWSYDVVDALVLRHPRLGRALWLMHRPWRVGEVTELVRRARELPTVRRDPASMRWVETLERAFPIEGRDEDGLVARTGLRAGYRAFARTDEATFDPAFLAPRFEGEDGAPVSRAWVEHDGTVQRDDRFAFRWRYALDSDVGNDPTRTRAGRFRSLGGSGEREAAVLLEAWGTFRWKLFQATLGRSPLAWGPGRGAPVFLGDSAPAVDQLRLELHHDRLRFTGVVGRLSEDPQNRSLEPDGVTIPGSEPPGSDLADVTRNLYAHRIELRLGDLGQVALTEGALVTGTDRGFEARYANLLMPFVLTQEDEDEPEEGNVNVVADIQGVFTAVRGLQIYGDWFAQTFFLLDPEFEETFGNQFAWRAGGRWAVPVGSRPVTVGGEYTRADVFMYLHRGLNTNWTTFGVPLGSTLGPDADEAIAWIHHWPTPSLRIALDGAFRREGERNVETLESFLEAGNPDVPSGTAQREWRLGAGARWFDPGTGLEGHAELGWRSVENIAHEPGRDDDFWELEIGLTYRGAWWIP